MTILHYIFTVVIVFFNEEILGVVGTSLQGDGGWSSSGGSGGGGGGGSDGGGCSEWYCWFQNKAV